MSKAKKIKTGIVYTVLNETVVNATRERTTSRQIMVLYEDDFGRKYVRELNDFNSKFKRL